MHAQTLRAGFACAVFAVAVPAGWSPASVASTRANATPAPQCEPAVEVTLSAPAAGSTYLAASTIYLEAKAADAQRVEFFANERLLGTVKTAPYRFAWKRTTPGRYRVTARAAFAAGRAEQSAPVDIEVKDPATLPLVQKGSMQYVGAFRLPVGGDSPARNYAYSGPLAYSAAHDSLLMVGHDWFQMIGEIGIPEVRDASTLAELDEAPVLQPFSDPAEGRLPQVAPGDQNGIKLGGMLPWGDDHLVFSAFTYYDSVGRQVKSHFTRKLALSQVGTVQGPMEVKAPMVGLVSGYMAPVPQAWRDLLGGPAFTGQCCINIISRSSFGPALFAFDPDALAPKGAAATRPLVYYPEAHPLAAWDATSPYFNGTTRITAVFMPEGTRSVLFLGRHGTGTFCYGVGGANGPAEPGRWCPDPGNDNQGTHAYPYVHQVWAYDALDLAAVASGDKDPWDVKPYAVWPLTMPFQAPAQSAINGAGYDPRTGRVFIAQGFADGERALINVFQVKTP